MMNYSPNLKKNMSRLAREFTTEEIGQQLASQIPWFTSILIISKSKSHEEMQLNKERNINI